MKKIYFSSLAILIILTSVSCKKDSVNSDSSLKTQQNDESKSFLKDVKSDLQAEYYISGEFDGYNIYCASTLGEYYPSNDTIMNAIYFNESIGLDNIHLLRENRDMTAMIAIYFDKAKIYTRHFPYTLPHANLEPCEAAQMEFINMKKLGTTTQCSPTDDYTFLGHTNSNIKVQVLTFEDGIIKGTFEGSLTTKTGSTIKVKNGEFRLKLINVNMGNQ